MSLDAIPSGFSSASALTLLKTMRSTQNDSRSFMAAGGPSPFQTFPKSTVSGNTIFSIIAAAAKSTSAPQIASGTHASAPMANDGQAIGGPQALSTDPYLQKNYTVDEAAQNYYAQMDQLANSIRNSNDGSTSTQSNGQILAGVYNLDGRSAIDFAAKFDARSLSIVDASTLGYGIKEDRYWTKDASGVVNGSGSNVSVGDAKGLSDWETAHPRSAWSIGQGHQGGGGLMITW